MEKIKIFSFIFLLAASVSVFAQGATDEFSGNFALPEFNAIHKRTAFIGFTGSASTRLSENEDVLLFKIIDQEKRAFNLLLSGGYMIRERLGVGLAIQYDYLRNYQTNEDADGIRSEISEAGSGLTTRLFVKNFIPITSSGRFNLFYDIGINIGRDRVLKEDFTQDVLTRTYKTTNAVGIGMTPGINVMVIKGFAVELGVLAAGFSSSTQKVYVNDVETTTIKKGDLDLKLNILALTIGFFYYFKT